MTLGEYLQQATAHRWEDGEHDCTTFPADWAVTWGRGDPMADWRGAYASECQAKRLISDAGGLDVLFDSGMAAIGVEAVGDLREGDVGVIHALALDAQPVQIGAIWTGRRWAFRIHNGIAFASAEHVAAWGAR